MGLSTGLQSDGIIFDTQCSLLKCLLRNDEFLLVDGKVHGSTNSRVGLTEEMPSGCDHKIQPRHSCSIKSKEVPATSEDRSNVAVSEDGLDFRTQGWKRVAIHRWRTPVADLTPQDGIGRLGVGRA